MGKSIQKKITNAEIIDCVIYENEPLEDIPQLNHHILAFTSSMNAEAYFSKHKLQPHQRVIAIGDTTAATLQGLGINDFKVAWQASEMGMVDVL